MGSAFIIKYALIFCGSYILFQRLITVVIQLTHINITFLLDFIFIVLSAYIASFIFVYNYRRVFNKCEYKWILISSVILDYIYLLAAFSFLGHDQLVTHSKKLSLNPHTTLLLITTVAVSIHTVILAFMYSSRIVGYIVNKFGPYQSAQPENYNVIVTFQYPWEADNLKAILESEGIPVILEKDITSITNVLRSEPYPEIKLLVPDRYIEQAKLILSSTEI